MPIKHGKKQFGLSPCVIQNTETGAWGYFLSPTTLTFNDTIELVEGMNSAGVVTEQHSGTHKVDGSLAVDDFHHLHLAVLAGYAVTEDTPQGAANIAQIEDVAGATWSGQNIVLANNAVPGLYHVKNTNAGVEQNQIIGFRAGREQPIMAAAPAGVANDDEALITVLPPTSEQGLITATGGTHRPAIRIFGWTDVKQTTGESGGQGVEVMEAYFSSLPNNWATVAKVSRELGFATTVDGNGDYYKTRFLAAI